MTLQETLYTIALSQLSHLKPQDKHRLLDIFGTAEAIYLQRNNLRDAIPDATDSLVKEVQSMEQGLARAEQEIAFMEKGHIHALGCNDEDYPQRLHHCADAPILLYYCGKKPLNVAHVVSVVGTRQITPYGKDLCAAFAKDLSALCPDALLVSGLAYGVDIHSHRAALENGLHTVAVLAHGLEQIYPRMHRSTAAQMVEHGGLLTEYISQTPMDKRNFVQRNRIVAGMADAVVVVESGEKGGSLITAEMAGGYERDVFAFPGRISDTYSAGCNMLIRANHATLIESAAQFVEFMGWESDVERQKALSDGIQQDLFPTLSADEQRIIDAIRQTDGATVNTLALQTGLPIGSLSSMLFALEMKGLIKKMNGNSYRL